MKINPNIGKTILKKNSEINQYINDNIGQEFFFFPFTIILGNINTTETGYKSNYSVPNDYFAFSKVFSGLEAVLAVWDNSYTVTQDLTKNTGIKKFKIGNSFVGSLTDDSLGIDFTPSASNSSFISEQVVKSVTMMIQNKDDNVKFINELPNNYFKLYQIPETNQLNFPANSSETNPYSNNDKQWYYISNVIKIRNKDTKKISYVSITFSSLNDKLAKTGLAINQYVQPSGPGEPFAFPKIINNVVSLNQTFLKPTPITHAQITFFGSVGTCNIAFMGRPVEKSEFITPTNPDYKISAPRLLFPYDYQAPIYTSLSLKAIASNNYYLVEAEPVVDTYFKDWRDNLAQTQLFDETNTKSFEGHIRSDKSLSKSSNLLKPTNTIPVHNIHKHNYWDSDVNSLDGEFLGGDSLASFISTSNVRNNAYFGYSTPLHSKVKFYPTFQPTNKISLSDLEVKGLKNVNMFNYFIFNSTYQVPLNVRETTPITLNSLPVIGGFLNKMFAGIPVGFKISSDSLPNNSSLYILWNCAVYDNYSDVLYPENNNEALSIIPFNAFDNSENAISALLGTNSQTTAFTFSLTDKVMATQYALPGVKDTGNQQIISTVDLAQTKTIDDKDYTYLIDKTSHLSKLDQGIIGGTDISGYYIDAFHIQVLGQCNYRIEFFSYVKSNGLPYDGPIDENHAVWVGEYSTFSQATKNTRLWTELKQLSSPLFNFDKTFNYPADIQVPFSPKEIRKSFNISNENVVIKKLSQQDLTDQFSVEHTWKEGGDSQYTKTWPTFATFIADKNTQLFYNFKNNPNFPTPPTEEYEIDHIVLGNVNMEFQLIMKGTTDFKYNSTNKPGNWNLTVIKINETEDTFTETATLTDLSGTLIDLKYTTDFLYGSAKLPSFVDFKIFANTDFFFKLDETFKLENINNVFTTSTPTGPPESGYTKFTTTEFSINAYIKNIDIIVVYKKKTPK